MKYLCLVYGDEDRLSALDEHECRAAHARLSALGQCLACEALEPVSSATTVRVRKGAVSLADGPFSPTQEPLSGFYLIEARDLNAAIALAARMPPAAVGCIEVRPIRPPRAIAPRGADGGSSRALGLA